MKRLSCFLFLLACASHALQAQITIPVTANVQVNNVSAIISSDGTLFSDGQSGQFIPVQPGLAAKTLLRGTGLWIVGKNPAGNIKGSVTLNGQTDLTPGLLDEFGAPFPNILNDIWQVSCTDINEHLADFNDNGIIDHPNANIYAYPAKGNPTFPNYNANSQLPFTPQPLAGFFDRDEDGWYGPYHGDYPSLEFRGCHPDRYATRQFWSVSNDMTSHPSGVSPNQTEVQTQVFAYKTLDASPLNNAIYVRYRIMNRSQERLDSCYFGLFADFDIGNPGDDFIGTIPDNSIIYGYNGDTQDEGGFNANIPVMAVDLLRGPLDSAGYELGIRHMMALESVDNLLPNQYFNLLSGHFADGSPAPNNGLMYPDNPNTPNGNSEQAAGNTPGPRVGLASFGPLTLMPGADNELIVGYYFVHTPGATPLQNVQQLYSDAAIVQDLFDNCFENMDLDCNGLVATNEYSAGAGLSVYPNPAALSFTIENEGAPFSTIALKDMFGREIRTIRLESPVEKYQLETVGLPKGAYILSVGRNAKMVVVL